MSERVAPELMTREEVVTLHGYERAFHKISWVRGCHPSDAALQVPNRPERFKTAERNLSLVLGLRPKSGAKVVGFLQTYPGEVAQEVLEQLDRREGFDANKPIDELAYLRRPCQVENAEGRMLDAVTYLTNAGSKRVDDMLSTESQAMILSGATSEESAGSKARGLFYLEGVRLALHSVGHHDQILEGLARCAYKWYAGRLHLLPSEV